MESVVGFHTVFGDVQASELVVGIDSYAHRVLDCKEDDSANQNTCDSHGNHTDKLRDKRMVGGEYTHCERAPHTAEKVYRESTDRVVNLDLIEEVNSEDNRNTRYDTDYAGGSNRDAVRTRRNTYQAGQAAIEYH